MKIIDSYKKMSLPAKASMWYLVCNILQKGISFITTPIFTRILSTEEYGTVSVFASWESILTIIATLYLSQGVFNNGMSKYKDDRDGFTLTMQTITSILTLLLVCLYIIKPSFWNALLGLSTPLMIMMFLDIFFCSASSFWAIRNRYEYKYFNVVVVTILATVATTALSLILVLVSNTNKAEAKIFGMVVIHVILYSIIYIVNIKKGRKMLNKKYATYALSFNIPLLPHYLSTVILNQSDRIMIDKMISTAYAGIYSLAYNTSMVMTIVTTSINNSFTPWVYSELDSKQYSKIGVNAIKIIIFVGFACLAVVLFAPEIIAILGTEEYAEAVWVMPPVAMSVLFIFVYCCFANIEFYYEQKRLILIGSVLSAVLNLALNFICIPYFGFVAAGYTTLVSYIVFTFFHYFSMKHVCKVQGISNPFNGILIFFICTGFVVLAMLANLLYLNNYVRYGIIACSLIIIVVLSIVFKDKIRAILKNKKGEKKCE